MLHLLTDLVTAYFNFGQCAGVDDLDGVRPALCCGSALISSLLVHGLVRRRSPHQTRLLLLLRLTYRGSRLLRSSLTRG
jgi:hypothetical protein